MRRLFAGALVLGAIAALLYAAVEIVYVAWSAWGYFDGAGEFFRFAGCALGVMALGGAVAGAAEGLIAAAIEGAAAQAGGPKRRAVWSARLYVALAAAPVALVCAQIFRGPRARTIPGHDLIAVAIGLAALAAIGVAVRRWQKLAASLDGGRRARAGVLWALACAAAAVGLYAANQRVLPRLYPFFHHGLAALAFFALQAALGIFYLSRPRARDGRSLSSPRMAAMVALVAALAGAGALAGFARARGLRSLALERTQPLARLLRAAQWIHPVAAAPARLADGAHPEVALPDSPRLGDVDVFIITVDAMRADRLDARTAPFSTALAASGVRFARAYAQVPHTSFSVATLLTGKHVYSLSAMGLDAAHHETLARLLRNEHYKTAAFYPPSVFFIDRDRLRALEQSSYDFEYIKYEYLAAPARTDQVIQFLETEKPERAFVWVHYLEPHEPYDPHPGYTTEASTTTERYDGEIRFVDDEIARLVGWERAHRRRALVVLAADHGEELGEHGGRYHGTTLYEEQVRVPLVFATVGAVGGLPARVVDGPVGLVDVAPTVLSLLGIPPSLRMRGRDLGPWMAPEPAPDGALGPEFAEIERKKMIALGSDKLICDLETESCELYDLVADPGERKNLVGDRARAEPLRARLDGWMAAETRFEQGGAAAGDTATRRTLERGRLGERAAAPDLAALLAPGELDTRREAARLLAALPADRTTAAALSAARGDADPVLRRWADVGAARLGDQAAQKSVAAWRAELCDGDDAAASEALCARAALAIGDVAALGRALERAGADRALAVELARALGASRDPRALDPLVLQLADVRTRNEVLEDIGALGDARALATLDRWVAAEPYIPARAAMARVIGVLAKNAGAAARADAERALLALAEAEREPPVMREAIAALGALGSAAVASSPTGRAGGGELWLVGEGEGLLEISAGKAPPTHVPFAGVVMIPASRDVRVRVAPGGPTVRYAYWRKAP